MKTPKEILFGRHAPAEPKLDGIRALVLDELADPPAGRTDERARSKIDFVATLWRELIAPWPTAWAGLAAVWAVIGWFSWSEPMPRAQEPVHAQTRQAARNVFARLKEQRELLAHELEWAALEPPPSPPGPRSEILSTIRAV